MKDGFFLKKKEKKKIYPDEEAPAGSMLLALAKPSQSAAEARRKTQAPPVVLSGLVQPQTSTLHPVSSRQDPRQQRPLSLLKKKSLEVSTQAPPVVLPGLVQPQTNTLHSVSSRQDSRQQRPLSLLKKKSLKDSGPAFPELSDENFGYLWMGKKMLGGRTLRETLEMMNKREILDTILQHLQPPPQKTSKPGHNKNALYRYYGLKLQDSRSIETVHQYLHLLLTLPLKEETDREEVIKEEPLASLSVLHQAMETIIRMTALRPCMDTLLWSQLIQKSIKKVFQLPSLQFTKVKAGSPVPATQSQDYYQETIYTCLNMITSLLSEAPSLEMLQEILVHTNGWIDSTKISERQRAVKSTNVLMKYVSEHLDFDVSQDFPLLGQLVALLSLHLADNVKEIGLQSAEALYHLHYIMIAKMDFFIPGPSLFYNDISEVAKLLQRLPAVVPPPLPRKSEPGATEGRLIPSDFHRIFIEHNDQGPVFERQLH
uniref:uncharacterized protein LOC114589091 isoform X2 n=1 Tax=Podarcis muralis TaxID=64176 RepID=UPI00109F9A6C|nr:uncharacterized protein LOC114589091 isoform X2 [Podarcis muralis]